MIFSVFVLNSDRIFFGVPSLGESVEHMARTGAQKAPEWRQTGAPSTPPHLSTTGGLEKSRAQVHASQLLPSAFSKNAAWQMSDVE